MSPNKVRFFGPLNNKSGYGNAVGNFASAFSSSNIDTKFIFNKNSLKENKEFVSSLNNYKGNTNIDFYIHPPPWSKHKSDKYKIAYFYWEADKLPAGWSRSLNQVDEIWVPCAMVANACKRTNFKGKIKIIPTPGNPFDVNENLELLYSNNYFLDKKIFKFYSIFQWHFRKGYDVLLTAYYSNFTIEDNVVLILKVNPLNINGNNKENIIIDINKIKKIFKNRDDLPLIYFSNNIISDENIKKIHKISDCYVAPHRGEGWGMPIYDAMFSGNSIITTKYGGITDYLDKNSALFIDYKLGPVRNMEWSPYYNKKQFWAEPSSLDLGLKMRKIYDNYNDYKHLGINAKKISESLSISEVSKIIENEINKI